MAYDLTDDICMEIQRLLRNEANKGNVLLDLQTISEIVMSLMNFSNQNESKDFIQKLEKAGIIHQTIRQFGNKI